MYLSPPSAERDTHEYFICEAVNFKQRFYQYFLKDIIAYSSDIVNRSQKTFRLRPHPDKAFSLSPLSITSRKFFGKISAYPSIFPFRHYPCIMLLSKGTIFVKGSEIMKAKPIITGISMGIAAGTVAYAVSSASSREKKMLRSRTGRAFHAMGDVMDGISMMMK